MLFGLLRGKWRTRFLSMSLVALVCGYALFPHTWHSNYISFACIVAGAFFATSEFAQKNVKACSSIIPWIAVCVLLTVGPLVSFLFRPLQFLMPFLIIYLIFAGREISVVGAILRGRFLQFVGSISYSLYLWQQLFLAKPILYPGGPFPIFGLLIAVALSVFFVERPSIRLGHAISKRFSRANSDIRSDFSPTHLPNS